MSDLLSEQHDNLLLLTLNRVDKHNAFDDHLLKALQTCLDEAKTNAKIRLVLLKANGRHFSAGADLAWMQRQLALSEEENIADARILARLMASLHHYPKPTLAVVHGRAMGGGAGLVAACDIGMAADNALFCFSEVKLGLTPAVISPYVIKAIGERPALDLFLSAETFDARRAFELGLVQHCVPEHELLAYALRYAEQIATYPPTAVMAAKDLVHHVAGQEINDDLEIECARRIAKQRVSAEAQACMHAFLNKQSRTT